MLKKCTACGVEKCTSLFSKQAKGKYGVTSRCRECVAEYSRLWHVRNMERSKAFRDAYATNNAEKLKEYRKEWGIKNKARCAAVAHAWTANNKHKKRASVALRRARLMQATPAWANKSNIEKMYALADRLSKATGFKANVDHIVPLKSDLVCGLHCEANLEVTTEVRNKSKGNHWWPQMPGLDEPLVYQDVAGRCFAFCAMNRVPTLEEEEAHA